MSRSEFDVVVIGGGPAGLAAAACAAECGARVALVDDNPDLGGQIWRGETTSEAAKWRQRVQAAAVQVFCGTRIFHQSEPGRLLAEGQDDLLEMGYRKLILATGARERFLPFPGWTLPNVMGAGGLQALVKSGLPIAGKRVLVAGSGPLLLAVAAYLRQHGAVIAMICEQTSWSCLARFGLALLGEPQKIRQVFGLRKQLAGVPFAANCWPVAARGKKTLEEVVVSRAGKFQTIPCDYLACGFHLVPNTELALLLGCQLRGHFVEVDDFQRTSVGGVLCAGEPTGIGGLELSLVEGQIAGLTAGGQDSSTRQLFKARAKLHKFARTLHRTFALRDELRSLPRAETILCRCEDVPYARVARHSSWRSAKLQTRCGMGPCQGRVCGAAAQFLFQWSPDSVRPPVFPVPVEKLAGIEVDSGAEKAELVGRRT